MRGVLLTQGLGSGKTVRSLASWIAAVINQCLLLVA